MGRIFLSKDYWMNELIDINLFNNFLTEINSLKNFNKITYVFSSDMDVLEDFLINNNISFFEFYISVLSLYLSRTSRSEGIIFSYSNVNPNDTLFKIRYDDKCSMLDFIISVKNQINSALDNSMVDLKDYINELFPEYCDYIFNFELVNQKNLNSVNNDSYMKFFIFDNSIEIEYNINSFSKIDIDFMLENIDSMISNFLSDIDQLSCDLDIISSRQLKLLGEFSGGTDFELADKLIPEIILETAKKFPDNFAINDEINRINYKDFANLVESTTYILQNNYKITKYDKVILYLPRTYNIPLLTICLMKLGAITIPIDDSYPEAYIQNIINDSSAEYIIHESSCKLEDIELIELTSLQTDSLTDIKYNIDENVDLDDTALILYTSGSTGVPKGVELTQRNIININYNNLNLLNIPEGGSGNFMCLAKFTFVGSIPIYGALMYGFEAFIIREINEESISKIVKYLKIYHCYILISTQELGLYLYNNFDLKLDNLALAGSSLSKQDIREDSSTVLWNAYGCTEGSGSVILNELNKDFSDYSVIGKPFGNIKIYILDDNKKQLPIGAVGEIVIGGPVVSKQYFNNPEQTSRSYGVFNGERVYFTNDLAYFNHEGNIVYVGRKDNLINLNGFRIEPEGVESTIYDYGCFNQVKVIMGKVNHQDHLIAYYSSDIDVDEDGLNEYLSVHLPSYMVPSFYVCMDSLPLNINGKIDVKSLPPVVLEDVDFVKPRNELEEIVVDIFERVFNQESIGVYDDFIQLGGTSVIAMKIVKELEDYNLSVNDLISLGTPEKIADYIKNNSFIDFDFDKYSLDEGCPLNESQLNVYLDIVRYEKNDVYNIPLTINIPRTYSADDIKVALYEMFNVHPILKSFIDVIDGVVCLKTGFNPKVDYKNEYDENVISDFMNKSFDLNFTLSRFLLVKKDDEEGFVLVSVFHHLIFDGFSSLVFKQHLFDLLEGKVLKLDEGIVKSSVYNEEIVKTQEYSDAEAFYESMLCEAADVSSFLSDVGDNEAGFHSCDLGVGKSDVDILLKSYGISENILFTGVFAYTLSRFTGDNKVLFNILDNGRDNLSNYESIGMFVNTLPLLIDCSDKDPVSFMDDVKDLIFNVFSYNFYPFRVLAQKYNINSSILFQYQPVFDEVNNQFFNVSDFEFRMFEKNNRYVVNVIYSGLFSSDTIRRFVESYNMILNQLLSVNKLSDINYISSSDLELLNTYNDTSCDLDYVDVLEAFNDNLSRNPDNILVSYEERSYTYGEGAFIADKIASSLKDLGVEVQDNVGFLVERSELYIFCVLGILSCGGVYVPLDDMHPDERIKFMLEDTGSRVVIVSDRTYSRVSDLTDSVILNISDIVNDGIGCLDCLPVVYGDLACILYTSGTTGVPKGVKVTRKSIINLCENYIAEYGLNEYDVYGMFSTIGFDMSIFVISVVMCSGACLAVVPEDIRLDMLELNEYFISHNVSHGFITTQVAKLFMEFVDDTSLDVLLVVGEKLGDFVEHGSYCLVDAYGPTESFGFVSSIPNVDKLDYSSVGFANGNVKFYILDDELRRVPLGAVGELFIAGYQLADGYLNRDEETSKAFLINPFDGGMMYRTGDMVRFLPDGSLGIVGRRDGQVKIRGNRVELGEVESVIRDMDIVEDVTVQTIDNGGNNELVAYVVLSDDLEGMDLLDCVRDYVSERKPDYMVPSYVVGLDFIPLTVNGKVDKGALPDVDLDVLHVEYVAPSNDVEGFFVRCFEELLSIDKVSVNDVFFDLGGDSLLAIKVIYKAINEGYSISYGDLFDNPTPRLLSKIVLNGDGVSVYDDYDYSLIDGLLEENNLYSFYDGECVDSLGNVLLLGSTGYIGMHVLYELLSNESGIIYCFIWSGDDLFTDDGFRELFNFYFDSDFEEFKDRLYFVEGDVNNIDDFMKLGEYDIDTVINCATNVKHHAHGNEIKNVNLYGAVNGLEFAKFKGARFVQVSTSLVAGRIVEGMSSDISLYEDQLYIGQNYVDNEYVESKFLAERAVLEYKVNYDLDVKIMRVNVMSYDSRFEDNYDTNPFIESIKSFVAIGKVPKSYLDDEITLSPIDSTAKSIVILSKTPKECTIFHPFNNNSFTFNDIVNVCNKLGLSLEIVDDEVFRDDFSNILSNETKQDGLFGIVSKLNRNNVLEDSIRLNNDYTMEVLSAFNFKWPEMSEEHLFDLITSYMRKGFF